MGHGDGSCLRSPREHLNNITITWLSKELIFRPLPAGGLRGAWRAPSQGHTPHSIQSKKICDDGIFFAEFPRAFWYTVWLSKELISFPPRAGSVGRCMTRYHFIFNFRVSCYFKSWTRIHFICNFASSWECQVCKFFLKFHMAMESILCSELRSHVGFTWSFLTYDLVIE